MNPHRILSVLCCLAISVVSGLGATGRKISDYTETLTVSDAWILEIAVPGVTNYKATFGAIATNIIARGSATVNTNKVDNYNGLVTNLTSRGLTLPALTAARSLFINASGNITNVSGTPDGTKYVRDDGTYAVPSGSGGGGGAGSFGANSAQFTTNTSLTIKDGALTTNLVIKGNAYIDGMITAAGTNINAFYGSNYFGGLIQIAVGSPGAGKVLTSDAFGNATWGAAGSGDVTTAQLNTASNTLYATETTRNSAVSNAVVALIGSGGSTQMVAAAIGTLTGTNISVLNITANRPLFINSLGQITNVTGTPNGAQYVRDDGVLATPSGAGDVSTAQLNTASNFLYSTETTRNAAVSNGVVTFLATGLTNLDVYVTLETFGHAMVASNLWVTQTITAARLDVVDFYANTATFTNGFYYTPNVNAGSGGNYTLLATRAESVIAATAANVVITAVMGYDPANAQYWNLTITNGSGSDRTLTFSAVTNSFRFAGVYGTNAPSVLTNNTQLSILGRSMGTNVLVKYDYFAWP